MIEYKNVANILLFNGKGELALQLRASKDDSFPSHWDFSAGGGIDEGEDALGSAEREVKEELGVEVKVDLVHQGHYQYPAWKPGVTRDIDMAVFRATYDGAFQPDPEEVDDVKLCSLDEVQKMIDSGEKFHPEFIIAWEQGIIK